MRKINKIRLFVNDNKNSEIVAKELSINLEKYNFKIVNNYDFDLGISVGGDGSFLRMIKDTKFDNSKYYIGVNAGTLGFLQEIDVNNCLDFIDRLDKGDYKEEFLNVQRTTVVTSDGIFNFDSLNEITVRTDDFNLFKADVYIDDEFLEHFAGDGFLVSTSTGSTAYSMSFGGSIVYNSLDTLSLVPIAPLSNRVYHSLLVPIVVPNNKVIKIVPDVLNSNVCFKIDGVNRFINDVKMINSVISNDVIKCIRMNNYHFVKIVSDKIIGN